jgi:hypothetical protein
MASSKSPTKGYTYTRVAIKLPYIGGNIKVQNVKVINCQQGASGYAIGTIFFWLVGKSHEGHRGSKGFLVDI